MDKSCCCLVRLISVIIVTFWLRRNKGSRVKRSVVSNIK